jgi:hypothetical protein
MARGVETLRVEDVMSDELWAATDPVAAGLRAKADWGADDVPEDEDDESEDSWDDEPADGDDDDLDDLDDEDDEDED